MESIDDLYSTQEVLLARVITNFAQGMLKCPSLQKFLTTYVFFGGAPMHALLLLSHFVLLRSLCRMSSVIFLDSEIKKTCSVVDGQIIPVGHGKQYFDDSSDADI